MSIGKICWVFGYREWGKRENIGVIFRFLICVIVWGIELIVKKENIKKEEEEVGGWVFGVIVIMFFVYVIFL